jgi:chromosome segregation ATPase
VKQASQVSSGTEAQQTALKEKVIKSLVASGNKLGSAVLSALAMKVAADPFIKVKKLIQDLIERLVTEAAEEATKKGWCDTETGKAEHNRDSNMNTIMELNAELEGLEATKAKLEENIATLTQEIADLNDSLTKETKMRSDEKAENMDTLDKAKAGLAATKDAYDVLQAFYKKAAKGKVSLIQASPVDADAPASHSGAYKGGQQKAGGILAMLDVIISDFERTVKVTTKAEKASHREFVEFERTSKTSIASKETGKSQAESDLKSTDSKIVEDMDDLDKHQKMLDDSLKELEDLKPACVDTGMSYADRVQKRKDEIDALKKALCELDPEKVEDECK